MEKELLAANPRASPGRGSICTLELRVSHSGLSLCSLLRAGVWPDLLLGIS